MKPLSTFVRCDNCQRRVIYGETYSGLCRGCRNQFLRGIAYGALWGIFAGISICYYLRK